MYLFHTTHTHTQLCHTSRYIQIGFSSYSYLGDQYQIQQLFIHSLVKQPYKRKCSQQLHSQRIQTLQNFTMLIVAFNLWNHAYIWWLFLQTVNAITGICKTQYIDLVTIRMGIYVKSNNPVL